MNKVLLKDVCLLEKGKQIDTKMLNDSHDYKYINGGIKESGFYSSYNTDGETVIVSEGGASCGYVNYIDEPFWCGCHCYRLTNIKVNPKYLYYLLKGNQKKIMALRTGAAMPNIKKSSFEKLQLNIDFNSTNQKSIVDELSSIETAVLLKTNQLESLNELIKSQFIAEINADKTVKHLKMLEIVKYLQKSSLKASGGKEKGMYPFFTSSVEQNKFTDEYLYDDECLIIGNGGVANIQYCNGKFSVGSHSFVTKSVSNDVRTRYMYLYFYSNMNVLEEGFRGVGIKNISKEYINDISILVPSIEKQDKLIDMFNQSDKSKFHHVSYMRCVC